MSTDAAEPAMQLDHDDRMYRYFRNAVERHWDPYAIDLDADRETLMAFDFEDGEEDFDYFRQGLALFGAGEEAVTEDLAPLGTVSESIEDEMFITTQMYEEAKHAEFFDRYWREVVRPVADEKGYERASPLADRYFMDDYDALFDSNERAMKRLLTDDTPENRVRAHAHYHLVIEGILAQTGYYSFNTNFGEQYPELPHLPGLVEGFNQIRSDEGRHVGFGMAKLKQYVQGGVDVDVLTETVNDLVQLTQGIVMESTDPDGPGMDRDELIQFSVEKHSQRMEQITDASSDIPSVEELTKLAD
jgi:ribonucleoside-diphosphate reductase beta chain